MSFNKSLIAIAIASSLAACGGSGGSSKSSGVSAEPVTVTADNLSQIVSLDGATVVSYDTSALALADSSSIASVTEVIVAANSSFSLDLSVPEVAGKSVAGYLIEFPDGSQQFVHVGADTSSAASAQSVSNGIVKSYQLPTAKTKGKKMMAANYQIAAAEVVEGETTVVISGWNSENFTLDSSLSDLYLRIMPLMVNETVANIAELTFEQIMAADGFEITMVQELALAVEAVATSTIQISLTWNTETDLDVYVLEPGFVYDESLEEADSTEDSYVISYYNSISTSSLGWLDRDNTEAYGPENITFNYQMPEGNYRVAVNYYSGSVETDYSLTVTVAGSSPVTYTGTFAADSSNYGDISDDAGTDILHTITVNSSLNSKLQTPVLLSQYAGTWQLPEESSVQGYMVIAAGSMAFYQLDSLGNCYANGSIAIDYFPTGFKVDGDLKVSDAFLNDWDDNDYTYAYRTLTKVSDTAVESCSSDAAWLEE